MYHLMSQGQAECTPLLLTEQQCPTCCINAVMFGKISGHMRDDHTAITQLLLLGSRDKLYSDYNR